jgi:hypothetical protein
MPRSCRRLVPVALALLACGEDPCTWDTSETSNRRDATIPTEPVLSLSCAGAVVDVAQELHGLYGGSVGVSADPADIVLFVRVAGGSVSADLNFTGGVANGSYTLRNPPEPKAPVWVSGAVVVGTFAFSRSRDVPFIDVQEPSDRVYQASIDVDFDLEITDSTGTPAGMQELGCTLATGKQRAHLVQRGPVRMCTGQPGGWH